MPLNKESKPRLKTTLYSLFMPDGQILILFSPDQQLLLPPLPPLLTELLMVADGFRTVTEITTLLNQKGFICTVEEVLHHLFYFYEKWLLDDLSDTTHEANFSHEYKEKFDRQLAFFRVWNQEGHRFSLVLQSKLQNTHVVLLGVGGFGSDIFYSLGAMGFGKITVADFDTVELSNLNRQSMYTEADIGKLKIDVLKEKTKVVETSRFDFINKKIAAVSDIVDMIGGADIAIIAADTPREKIFYWMNEASYQTGIPCLFTSGAAPAYVFVGPLVVPGKTACYACSMPDIPFPYDHPLVQWINQRNRMGVILPYIRVAAGLMSLELVKHVTGFAPCQLYGQTLKMNLLDYSIGFHKTSRRETCPLCGETSVTSTNKQWSTQS